MACRACRVLRSSAQSTSQTTATGSERKVLYWYDAMNPQHHYDKPGKAPDGMDLVPQYAGAQAPASWTISLPLHLHHFVGLRATRRDDLDLRAFLLADQCARER